MRSAIVVLNVEDPFLGSAAGLARVVDEAYRWYRQGKPVVVALSAPKSAGQADGESPGDLAGLLDRCGIPAAAMDAGGERHSEILTSLSRFPVVIVHGLSETQARDLGGALSRVSGSAFAQLNLLGANDASNADREKFAGRRLKVGLLGLGVVGNGVFQSLSAYRERFEITGIAVRDLDRIDRLPFRHLLRCDPWKVVNGDADVVIELIGGHEPAYELIVGALLRGKHVVTANKLVVSRHARELSCLARQHGGSLHFAAAVGGAVPMLEAARTLRGDGPVESLRGVLNGTCNFVLDELAQGRAFPEAVERAQSLGFAEADPTLDLDGTDTAHKLMLLAQAACGADLKIENIERRGILDLDGRQVRSLAESGKAVRLVASLASGPAGVRARVAPEVVEGSHPFARIRGEQNCLIARQAGGCERMLRGKGAGRWPTTVSVMSDVLAIAAPPPALAGRGGAA